MPLLSIIIFLPIITCFVLSLSGKSDSRDNFFTIVSCAINIILTFYLLVNLDLAVSNLQFTEKTSWIDSIGLEYQLGANGFSLLLVLLNNILTLLVVFFTASDKNRKPYLICFLLLQSLNNGVFFAQNLLLFYIFFEALLIPMYLIIGIWGGENRVYATFKFFIYTLFGSLLLLVSIIYIYNVTGSLNIQDLGKLIKLETCQVKLYLAIAMLISFAIKLPMAPFHTWLPDAHVQAPTGGSVILAGVLLKVGGYAIISILLPIFPDSCRSLAIYVIIFSLIAIIYASLIAYRAKDIKRIIAYSSVAHMGYVTAAIFSFNKDGQVGAMFQMISHGIISSGLFFSVGILYSKMKTKDISAYGGMAKKMPIFAALFMIFVLANIGIPGTSGFVAEFISLIGIIHYNIVFASIACLGVIVSVIYMIRLYRKLMLGEITNDAAENITDINKTEIIVLSSLAAATILFGIYPELLKQFLSQFLLATPL